MLSLGIGLVVYMTNVPTAFSLCFVAEVVPFDINASWHPSEVFQLFQLFQLLQLFQLFSIMQRTRLARTLLWPSEQSEMIEYHWQLPCTPPDLVELTA